VAQYVIYRCPTKFQKQVAYYDSLNLLDYILNKISFDKNNKYNIYVKVIRFNSKKFEINIFVNHITDSSVHIKSVTGTETQYKSLSLTHDNYVFPILFLDLKSFQRNKKVYFHMSF
jgi:hypothetical protein